LILKFLPITNEYTGSLQFRINDYLALSCIVNKTGWSLEPNTVNMLMCLHCCWQLCNCNWQHL